MGFSLNRIDEIYDGEQIDTHTKFYATDDTIARRMELPKWGRAASHKHKYDHISIVTAQTTGYVVQVIADGVHTKYESGDCITLPAGVEHEIIALENIKWFCVHASTEKDPAKQDEVLILNE